MNSRISTQRLRAGSIFGEGWRLYRATFTTILPVIVLVQVPINIILALIPFGALAQSYGLGGRQTLQLYNITSRLLVLLIGSIATVAIAHIVESAILGRSTTWQESLRHGLARWGSAIGTGLLASIIIGGLSLLLIIPGIIWGQYYTFGIYVVALRGIGGKAALDYSKRLVKGQWWRVFGIDFATVALVSLASMGIDSLFALVSNSLIVGIIANTIGDILSALPTIVLLVLFLNTDYLRNPSVARGSEARRRRARAT